MATLITNPTKFSPPQQRELRPSGPPSRQIAKTPLVQTGTLSTVPPTPQYFPVHENLQLASGGKHIVTLNDDVVITEQRRNLTIPNMFETNNRGGASLLTLVPGWSNTKGWLSPGLHESWSIRSNLFTIRSRVDSSGSPFTLDSLAARAPKY
ncbi:hypothetical protein PoB_001599000 [Plakobranchus ocellatus]|uniref:Uncharacterized protein n=1 Tax=Plakobranchus ocellatus TaxID=259542 RepID=A0AAV3Z4E1_9GAST|nr:hypothetical protein PoB_001599000 [Plakobranchus ocellatus]